MGGRGAPTRKIKRRGGGHRRRASRKWRARGGGETPTAVIVEPRQHRALPFVLRNFAANLPPEWSILVLHGTENEAWLKGLLGPQGELAAIAPRIRLSSLGVAKLRVDEYNKMLKTTEFYERHIPTERFLIFQVDSMICAPHKDLLAKFMDYDYVGAPWNVGGVGNGGLSLRRKSAVIKKLKACPPTEKDAEDGFFSTDCATVKLNRPSDEEAREFSIETVYSPTSWGIHKAWAHLPHKIDALETQCPGIKELKGLQ